MSEVRSGLIFLVGFMGCGKTTVGRRLAYRLRYDFADLDQLLVEREQRSIPQIFSESGEEYFRDRESTVLASLAGRSAMVVATGGGIVGRTANRELMKRLGTVIYLQVGWPILERRLSRSSGRPLADPQRGMEPVRRLWESRLPWYGEADFTVDVDQLSVKGVVDRILNLLNPQEGQKCSS